MFIFHALKGRKGKDISLGMVDSDVEVEVWVSLSVRGKLVSFSSLGRFQDSYGIKKEVVTSREDKYCSVGVGDKKFYFHDLVCTAFHGEKPAADYEAHNLDPTPENNRPDKLCWLSQ